MNGSWIELPCANWMLSVLVAEEAGVRSVIGLRMEPKDGHVHTITQDDLRAISLKAVYKMADEHDRELDRRVRPSKFVPRGGGGPAHAKARGEHYKTVAKDYMEILQAAQGVGRVYSGQGFAPVQILADKYRVSRTTAARWLVKCRDMGFLERGGHPNRIVP